MQPLELTRRPWLYDVEGAKKEQGQQRMWPVRRCRCQGNPLAADLIQHHMPGIFAAAFASNDRACWNADCQRQERPGDGKKRYLCYGKMRETGDEKPKQRRCNRSPGPRSRLPESSSKEGSRSPRPECLTPGRHASPNLDPYASLPELQGRELAK